MQYIEEKFPALADEINAINKWKGTVGILDALEFIQSNEEEYEGTACRTQFRRFMREMSQLFV